MYKKNLTRAVISLLAVGALVVTACATPSSDGVDASAGKEITLRYAIWAPEQEGVMQEIAETFHEKNPNIKIDVDLVPWQDNAYWTKLQTESAGGTAPDVFWIKPSYFQLYASNGMLADISDTFDSSNYPAALSSAFAFGGKQYAYPKDFDTVALWYNKTLFDAAEVTYPDEEWTWDDVRAASTKLTDPAAGVYGISALMDGQTHIYPTIFQAGGHVVSEDGTASGYDDPATQEGIQFWVDFVQKGEAPTQAQQVDVDPIQMFQNQKVAMLYAGDWQAGTFGSLPELKDVIDVAPLPAGPETKATISHGIGNAVYANGKNLDAAKLFAEYLGGEEAAMTQSKVVIPAFNGTQQGFVDSQPGWNLQVFIDALDYAVPLPVSKNPSVWNKEEVTQLGTAWTLEVPVAGAADTLAVKMNDALAKEQEN